MSPVMQTKHAEIGDDHRVRVSVTIRVSRSNVMRTTIWSVCWRGLEEQFRSREDALDRWDQLDSLGIEAELYEVAAGRRRKVR
jgi:hypothetical protein